VGGFVKSFGGPLVRGTHFALGRLSRKVRIDPAGDLVTPRNQKNHDRLFFGYLRGTNFCPANTWV